MAAKAVWKFPIPVDDVVTISMPRGAKILHVGDQFGNPMMWALVDPGEPCVDRQFRFAGTGHPVYDHHIGEFIGTFFLHSGSLVFHIWETQASQMESAVLAKPASPDKEDGSCPTT